MLLFLCFTFGWFCCSLSALELFPLFPQFAFEFGRLIQRAKLRPGVSFSPGCAGVMVIQRERFPVKKLVGILIHWQVRGLKDKTKTFHALFSWVIMFPEDSLFYLPLLGTINNYIYTGTSGKPRQRQQQPLPGRKETKPNHKPSWNV